jgi:anti-sigma B factor antagonist
LPGAGVISRSRSDAPMLICTAPPQEGKHAMLDSPVRSFHVENRRLGSDVCVVAVEGEVDLASAPDLRGALLHMAAGEGRRLVVDLARVTHMDSTGLGVLVGVQRRLPPEGAIVIAAAPAAVRDLFALTGLDRAFKLYDTVDQAIAELVAERPARPVLSADAALVVGLAATAIPFADSRSAQIERWLRMLRLYGDASRVLNALGLGEAPLVPIASAAPGEESGDSQDAVARVTEHALRAAVERAAATVTTGDLLAGVMALYGEELDRVLEAHGASRGELAARLNVRGSERSER